MNKKEALALMSKDAGITAAQAEKAFNQLIHGMKDSLQKGEKVTFSGFGSFEVKNTKKRKGRNPGNSDDSEFALAGPVPLNEIAIFLCFFRGWRSGSSARSGSLFFEIILQPAFKIQLPTAVINDGGR